MAIQNHPLPSRTPQQKISDFEKGVEWRNYVIVSDNHLGAINLGLGWLLYIDPNHAVWYLKLGYEVSGSECVMSCTLQSVFGRFGRPYPTISRVLAQAQTQLNIPGNLKPLNRFTFERNLNGSEVLIHVYAQMYNENSIELPEPMKLCEVWKLELFGSSELNNLAMLGNGIEASISKYKSYDKLHQTKTERIERVEDRYRIAKVNIEYKYDPKPTEPPECNSNYRLSSFALKLVPETAEFTPFELDKNTYTQTNEYGSIESKISIVRMLFDKDGHEHVFKTQKQIKRLNKIYQSFEGQGSGIQGPIQYYFNGWTCVVNGWLSGWNESYTGEQISDSMLDVMHEAAIFVDDEMKQNVSLRGKLLSLSELKLIRTAKANYWLK